MTEIGERFPSTQSKQMCDLEKSLDQLIKDDRDLEDLSAILMIRLRKLQKMKPQPRQGLEQSDDDIWDNMPV